MSIRPESSPAVTSGLLYLLPLHLGVIPHPHLPLSGPQLTGSYLQWKPQLIIKQATPASPPLPHASAQHKVEIMPSILPSQPEVLLSPPVRLFFHVSLSPPFLPLLIPSSPTHSEPHAQTPGDISSARVAQPFRSGCLVRVAPGALPASWA